MNSTGEHPQLGTAPNGEPLHIWTDSTSAPRILPVTQPIFPAGGSTIPVMPGTFKLTSEFERLEKLVYALDSRLTTSEIERGILAEVVEKLRLRLGELEKSAPQSFDRILKDITEKEQRT